MWGPWGSWYILRDVEFEWDVVPVPIGTEEAVLAWGSTLAAFESSENQDAVRQFMDFFAAPEKQFVIDAVANGRAPFVHREEARLQNIYNQELSLVTSGDQTMAEALATIQEAWQEILDE